MATTTTKNWNKTTVKCITPSQVEEEIEESSPFLFYLGLIHQAIQCLWFRKQLNVLWSFYSFSGI